MTAGNVLDKARKAPKLANQFFRCAFVSYHEASLSESHACAGNLCKRVTLNDSGGVGVEMRCRTAIKSHGKHSPAMGFIVVVTLTERLMYSASTHDKFVARK